MELLGPFQYSQQFPFGCRINQWISLLYQLHRLSNLNLIIIHTWQNTLMEMYDPCFASYMIYDDDERWSIAFQDQSKSLGLINSSPKSGTSEDLSIWISKYFDIGWFYWEMWKGRNKKYGQNWKDGGHLMSIIW